MSGHSKWSTIKRAKGVTDAKRSQVFTKLSKLITVAARQGADPTMNFKLRLAIAKARDASMPKENIDRAVRRGAGNDDGAQLEELTYEGYGPGGVAFLMEVLTDNRNRTISNIRHILERFGGRLADSGSVAWMFSTKNLTQLALPIKDCENLELALIEAGADDIKEFVDELIIISPPDKSAVINKLLLERNLTPSYSAIEPVANNFINISDEQLAARLDKLREALNSDDDINNIYDNAD